MKCAWLKRPKSGPPKEIQPVSAYYPSSSPDYRYAFNIITFFLEHYFYVISKILSSQLHVYINIHDYFLSDKIFIESLIVTCTFLELFRRDLVLRGGNIFLPNCMDLDIFSVYTVKLKVVKFAC